MINLFKTSSNAMLDLNASRTESNPMFCMEQNSLVSPDVNAASINIYVNNAGVLSTTQNFKGDFDTFVFELHVQGFGKKLLVVHATKRSLVDYLAMREYLNCEYDSNDYAYAILAKFKINSDFESDLITRIA